MTIGENIAWAREERGLSQQQLAEDVLCTRTYISDVETGKRQPSRNLLRNIAGALNVDVEDLEV